MLYEKINIEIKHHEAQELLNIFPIFSLLELENIKDNYGSHLHDFSVILELMKVQ